MQFNEEKHYLGKLCPKKHEYENTGKSVRYKIGNRCFFCTKEKYDRYVKKNKEKTQAYAKKYQEKYQEKSKECKKKYAKKNMQKIKEYQKEYRIKNREKLLKKKKEYRIKNREKVTQYRKEYGKKECVQKRMKERDRKRINDLNDIYIKKLLLTLTPFESAKEIPEELVNLKRQQLLMTRNIREIKNGIA